MRAGPLPGAPSGSVIPLPSASILVVRDGADGLEVLSVHRSQRMGFAAGMLAFPGGRVDPADRTRRIRQYAQRPPRRPADDLAFRIAALRELFEETGLLLAVSRSSARPLRPAAWRRHAARYRRRVHEGSLGFGPMLARTGLALATRTLVPFAHWVTPAIAPKRFDTRFYLAAAPARQQAASDGVESLALAWRRPADLLAEWEAGTAKMMFPTRLNLVKLGRAGSVAEALAQARAAPAPKVTPALSADGRPRLMIPAEAGFGITEAAESDLDPLEQRAVQAHLAALREAE